MGLDYKYKVCTQCLTFNHAPFIEDALKGFAMQQTTFPIVTVVADDASTDGAQEILKQWIVDHLDKQDPSAYEKQTEYARIISAPLRGNSLHTFVILLFSENLYSKKISKIKYLKEWTDNSKYIALCEGDDYWISSDKLQCQVDVLDNNDQYSICSHRIFQLNQDTGAYYEDRFDHLFKNGKGCEFNNRTRVWLTETSSVMYRNACSEQYYNYSGKKRDNVHVYFLLKGNVGYCLKERMSIYRRHKGGVFSKQSVQKRILDGSYKAMKELYEKEKTADARYLYYRYYASTFVLTKGRILFLEKFDAIKFLSLLFFIPSIVFMKHPSYIAVKNGE